MKKTLCRKLVIFHTLTEEIITINGTVTGQGYFCSYQDNKAEVTDSDNEVSLIHNSNIFILYN